MSGMNFLERLLDGVAVEWKDLGEIGAILRGTAITEKETNPGDYPVGANGPSHNYFHDQSNRSGETIVIARSGVYAGLVSYWDIPIFLTDAFSIHPDNNALSSKFLYYVLKKDQTKIHNMSKGAGVPHVRAKEFESYKVPIPPIEIQAEIVRILDTFTALTAELTDRKKQYNYYRDRLLTFEESKVEWKTLGEVFQMRAGQHISASKIMQTVSDEYIYPCFGGNGVRGFVNENSHDGAHLLIGRQGALCGNVQRMKGKFYATEHVVVVTASEQVNIDWAFHLLTIMNLNQYASQSAQPGLAVGKFQGLKIPIPSLEEQVNVASILDKFDTLTHSISEGLPREIALRQQQYEYYRDLLLTFPKPEEVEANLATVEKSHE